MPRIRISVVLASWLAAVLCSAAAAATPLSPINETTNSTPTFTWELQPGEYTAVLEYAPDPTVTESGGFGPGRRILLPGSESTRATVLSNHRLYAGTWYWHLKTYDSNASEYRWTSPQQFEVLDEVPVVEAFKVVHRSCPRQLRFSFHHVDNSPSNRVHWRLDLVRGSNDRPTVRFSGSSDHRFKTRNVRSLRLPPGRYQARLVISDPAGQTAEDTMGLRIERC